MKRVIQAGSFFAASSTNHPGNPAGTLSSGRRSAIVEAKKLRSPSVAMRGSQLAAWLFRSPGVEPNSIRLLTFSGDVIARFCAR